MSSVVLEISKINGPIRKFHISFAYFEVKAELSFIDSIRSEFNSKAMLHAAISASKIKSIVIVKNCEGLLLKKFFACEQGLIHLVALRIRKVTISVAMVFILRIDIGDNGHGLLDFLEPMSCLVMVHFYSSSMKIILS